jgi:hypothetical protein
MNPEFVSKWEHILEDVEKSKVPVQFIKKIVVRMIGKKQYTINIQSCANSQRDSCLIAPCILGGHRIELINADGSGRPKAGRNHAA